ncbi:PREDICTED: uncharacterized protein LOC109184100 [Ipomoea nil]|uniref:uncharacterized protein LOC109184100 n=1 Tax=Ipomoea nil TaxID=35883 RepID=UPI0009014ECF|nr:PREDICTED: uncharacterized protein LOC109184100 [Ipomoea nil]
MKIVHYAMLISKVKTILEKEHQNDPACSVSGSKDEQGRELDTTENEEEDDTDDVEDADDENDDDDDNNDDSGNDGDNGANLNYDSESPLLVGPDYDTVPERSPAQKSPSHSDGTREASQQDEDVSTNHPEDLSQALVPHVQPMNETPIKREEAVVHEGKLEASPILLSSGSRGKKDAPLEGDQVETPQTNIEDESPPVSPRVVMNLMRETLNLVHHHKSHLNLHRKLILTNNFTKRVAKELYELNTAVNKVARQQHELKHSHFSLKERVDLACSKIDTSQDNSYQLGQYALQTLEYAQDILNAVNQLSIIPPTTCADDAKKVEKRHDDDDRDDDHPRENTRERWENTRERSPSLTPRDSGQRSTNPPSKSRGHHTNPPSKSRGHQSSQTRHYSNRGRSQPRSQSLKPRQFYGSESQFVFAGLSKREKANRRQKFMKDKKITMDGVGNFVEYKPYEEGSGKRFEGCNVPTWLKTKDNCTRQHHISTQNERIKRQNRELWEKHEEEARIREHELKERERE